MNQPCFHRPVILQAQAGVPLEQLLNVATSTANDLSARGWDVCLPPMIVPSGGPLVGSQRTVNVVLWIRCPADSPLVHEQLAAPPGTHNSKVAAAIESIGTQREAVQV